MPERQLKNRCPTCGEENSPEHRSQERAQQMAQDVYDLAIYRQHPDGHILRTGESSKDAIAAYLLEKGV